MIYPASEASVSPPLRACPALPDLALMTPLLAVIWMAFISKLDHPNLSWHSAHFRAFWLWDAIGLASVTWAIGLLTRILRPRAAGGSQRLLWVALIVAVAVAGYAGQVRQSRYILLAGVPLIVGVLVYLGSWPVANSRRGAQPLTICLCAFLAAGIWMSLGFEEQSLAGLFGRFWLAMGCAVGAWFALAQPQLERPQLQLAQEALAGYIFAAGVALAPGIWGGEVPQLFAGDQTLLLAVLVGVNRWMKYSATLPEGPERHLLSYLIPLSLCALLALVYAASRQLLRESSNLTDSRMCLVLALCTGAMLLVSCVLRWLSGAQLRLALTLCLGLPPAVLLMVHW